MAKLCVIESVCSAPGKIDRDNGIIPNVKILGRISKNKRLYTDAAMSECVPLYEGMRVNIDHPEKAKIKSARGTLEQWGWLQNVSVKTGCPDPADDGVYGNLHYLKTHPHTETLLELAERRPDKFGLSHNADCLGHLEGQTQVIEGVELVRSVDLVQNAATNFSLFEGTEEMPKTFRTTIKAILDSAPPKTLGRRQLLHVLEMDGDMGATPVELTAASPDATASDMSPQDQIWQAFRTAVISYLDDDTDIPTTLQNITDALNGFESSFGSANPPPDSKEGEAEPAMEGVEALRREVVKLRLEGKARDILEGADIAPSPGKLKAVISVMESADELGEVLASFPKRAASNTRGETFESQRRDETGRARKPAKSAPLMEGAEGTRPTQSALPYSNRAEFAKMIR